MELAAQKAGKPKPKSKPTKANRERLKKRRITFVMRQHSGQYGLGAATTRVYVLTAETAAEVRAPITDAVKLGSMSMFDENAAYSWLSQHFEHHVVNHQLEYSSAQGINENQAESFFSRLRRYVLVSATSSSRNTFWTTPRRWLGGRTVVARRRAPKPIHLLEVCFGLTVPSGAGTFSGASLTQIRRVSRCRNQIQRRDVRG